MYWSQGNGHNVSLTIDASLPANVPGGVLFDGGSGTATLIGPDADRTWDITGPGTGDLGGSSFVRFTGVDNLLGGANNRDTFDFAQGGSLRGTVDGGAGGYDTVVFSGVYGSIAHVTTGAVGYRHARQHQVRYSGMEPIQFTQAAQVFTYSGTTGNDSITLSDVPDAPGAQMQIAGTGELVQFVNPTDKLIINGLAGDDTIVVQSVDPAFSADLVVDGNDGNDSVTFAGSLRLPGHALSATGENDPGDGRRHAVYPADRLDGGPTLRRLDRQLGRHIVRRADDHAPIRGPAACAGRFR